MTYWVGPPVKAGGPFVLRWPFRRGPSPGPIAGAPDAPFPLRGLPLGRKWLRGFQVLFNTAKALVRQMPDFRARKEFYCHGWE